MRKPLSLFLTIVLLLSTICLGATAVETETVAKNAGSTADRISFSGSELEETFGIEQILLPEGYIPVAHEFFHGNCDGELPKTFEIVFNDGSNVKYDVFNNFDGGNTVFNLSYSGIADIITANGQDLRISCRYTTSNDADWVFELSVFNSQECKTFDKICDKQQHSFSENIKDYLRIFSACFSGIFKGKIDGVNTGLEAELQYNIISFFVDVAQANALFAKYIANISTGFLPAAG